MKYLLLALLPVLGSAQDYVTAGGSFNIEYGGTEYSIEIIAGGNPCPDGQNFRHDDYNAVAESLCEAIEIASSSSVNSERNFYGPNDHPGWSPGGCFTNAGIPTAESGYFYGDVVYSLSTADVGIDHFNLYCITNSTPVGDPDPCDPAPTTAAEYIDAQCCDC